MQIEDVTTKVETPSTPVQDEPQAETLTVTEHRIYVWSAPSPYSVVIQESRSFHRHI